MWMSGFQTTATGIVELQFFNGYGRHPGSRKTLLLYATMPAPAHQHLPSQIKENGFSMLATSPSSLSLTPAVGSTTPDMPYNRITDTTRASDWLPGRPSES